MTWLITFYCVCLLCCGKTPRHPAYGITRSGNRVEVGVTVACDERLLGRAVWIEGMGVRFCDDTGRLVRGRHIDVYVKSHAEGVRRGRQKRVVRVLP